MQAGRSSGDSEDSLGFQKLGEDTRSASSLPIWQSSSTSATVVWPSTNDRRKAAWGSRPSHFTLPAGTARLNTYPSEPIRVVYRVSRRARLVSAYWRALVIIGIEAELELGRMQRRCEVPKRKVVGNLAMDVIQARLVSLLHRGRFDSDG